jgi:release factor glutamine methyltransferase
MPSARDEPVQGTSETQWTTRSLMAWMTRHFDSKGVESPRLVAEMLLAHVIGCERLRLYMDVDRPTSPLELNTLRSLVVRAAKHEPVQYLVGEGWFYGQKFAVNRCTLIPRPSTETLVEHVLRWLEAAGITSPVIADVGTGTGCIAVSLAFHARGSRLIATDIVPEVLELARRNAEAHGVADRVELHEGGGVVPLRHAIGGGQFDAICSNPPYIPDSEWADVPDNVRLYEPESALRGGMDGLAVVRPLIADAPELLRVGGQLVIEIADSCRDAVQALAEAHPMLTNVRTLKDHEGLWRVLVAERKPLAA